MWQSYKDDSNAMRCILAMGVSPRLPISRVQKIKFFLFGRVFKREHNR